MEIVGEGGGLEGFVAEGGCTFAEEGLPFRCDDVF